MKLHSELRALQADDSPQRLAQQHAIEALARWRATPEMQAIETALADFAAGAILPALPALAQLFAPGSGSADRLVDSLVGPVLRTLAQVPLAQVPLRHFTDDCVTSVMLARRGGATLALQASHAAGLARRPPARTAGFSAAETWERVLAGTATGELVTLQRMDGARAVLETRTVALGAGTIAHRSGGTEALLLRRVEGSLVSLKLQRRHIDCPPTREFDLADGTLVHQAAGTARDSRLELSAALLGRMGRNDAAPLLAELACEAGSPALRWQALRECLGLDTAAGFAALCRIAADCADPLAAPAGALRARLIEDHPQLAGAMPCPA